MNITFTPGIYGILGANGAGKSTMMNLLTDNISRTDGQILFDGTDILKLGKDFRRVLGYMPQQQGFYEHMTAQTFLYYMADLKGIPKKQAAQEIDALLEVTNLSYVRHKKLGGYSRCLPRLFWEIPRWSSWTSLPLVLTRKSASVSATSFPVCPGTGSSCWLPTLSATSNPSPTKF